MNFSPFHDPAFAAFAPIHGVSLRVVVDDSLGFPEPVLLSVQHATEAQLVNGELAYFKSLTGDDAKKAFLAMSAAERTAAIGKA